MGSSKHSTAVVISPVLNRGQGSLQPAACSLVCTVHNAIGLFCKDALLVHGLLSVHHFFKAAFQLVDPQHVLVRGLIPPQVQFFAFSFIELPGIPVNPFLLPVQVLLNNSPDL